MNPPAKNPWFPLRSAHPNPRLRLFCLPHAGGGALSYRPWGPAFPPDVEVVAVQPPGREGRLFEAGFERMELLVRAVADALRPLLDRPYILFGHSMGALTAYELTRLLRREGQPAPAHLVVSGCVAPHLPSRRRAIHGLPDAEFKEELRKLNGTPQEVLENQELLSLLMPPLRRDFTVVETYVHAPEPALDVPLSAFGGDQDPNVLPEDLEGWAAHTTAAFQMQIFPGDHFYLHRPGSQLRPTVVTLVTRHLRRE